MMITSVDKMNSFEDNSNEGSAFDDCIEMSNIKSDVHQLKAQFLRYPDELRGLDWIFHVLGIEKWVPIGVVQMDVFEYVKLSDLKNLNLNEDDILNASKVESLKRDQNEINETEACAQSINAFLESNGFVRQNRENRQGAQIYFLNNHLGEFKAKANKLLSKSNLSLKKIDKFLICCNKTEHNGKLILTNELNKLYNLNTRNLNEEKLFRYFLTKAVRTSEFNKLAEYIFDKPFATTEFFGDVINNLEKDEAEVTSILAAKRIFANILKIKEVRKEAVNNEKSLSDFQLLKICAFAEMTFLEHSKISGNFCLERKEDWRYYSKNNSQLKELEISNSIIVKSDEGRYVYALKLSEFAKIKAQGGLGSVKSIIVLSNNILQTEPLSSKHLVQKTALKGPKISPEEILYTKKYQPETSELNYINSKGDSKKTFITEAFENDLTKIDTKKLANTLMLDYLRQIATQLELMHSNNDIHSDIKLNNILYKKGVDEKIKLQISDYGMMNKKIKLYGTIKFSSPETLQHSINSNNETRKMKASDDIYALGLLLFHMIAGKYPDWSKNILSKYESENVRLSSIQEVIRQQNNVNELIEGLKSGIPKDTPEGQFKHKLLEIDRNLLNPDVNERMTAKQLVDCISNIDG